MLHLLLSPFVFSQLFILFLILKTSCEIYLSWRNENYVYSHRNKVPECFAHIISIEDHQKAAQYTSAKSRLGRAETLFSALLLFFWIRGGGLNFLDLYFYGYFDSQLSRGVVVIVLFSIINSLLALPWSLYQTFVLEEKFGFNKTTVSTFVKDLFKQILLSLVLGLPILYALLLIMEKLGKNWWWVAWSMMVAFQFLMMWAWPRFLAPLFNKFTPLEEGELKNKIEKLLERCQFKSSGLFVMNASLRSSHGNAYFTGLGKNKRIVFFDTLIKTLTANEVEAVLAHELGHFKLKHIRKTLIRSTLLELLAFWILGKLISMPSFYLGHHIDSSSTYMGLLLFSLVTPLYTFFLTPLFTWYSRNHEYEADNFAKKYSNGHDLSQSLLKMYRDNASTLTPDPLYSSFYYSHPSALERIKNLELPPS